MTATAKTSTALADTKGDFVKSKCAYVKHKSPSFFIEGEFRVMIQTHNQVLMTETM